ncbi:DNA-directed RNA polymerase specialized sigma24 family protein [Hamadaea flava]|uniref:Helix-turn-helix domain-containing protein n=1 Tax=Hamadaea flava TaxID=1742688 RepID=A0ABV8LX19_9ACTN|nr:helix-turn-helix domain-containing protein [Hamadaea flava]MCP2327830.1 DNA-directed RNA polymerase specialized sigma24 family protein [Hamadaea flava]
MSETDRAATERLTAAASSTDPAVGLRAVRALRELAERLEAVQVRHARNLGWTWQEIAVQLGVTRQAVHKKFGAGRGLFGKEK